MHAAIPVCLASLDSLLLPTFYHCCLPFMACCWMSLFALGFESYGTYVKEQITSRRRFCSVTGNTHPCVGISGERQDFCCPTGVLRLKFPRSLLAHSLGASTNLTKLWTSSYLDHIMEFKSASHSARRRRTKEFRLFKRERDPSCSRVWFCMKWANGMR